MKFFSNEAKETDDRDRTDADANAVPQQRAGSPWNDAPRDNDDELADRDRRDDTVDSADDRSVDDRPADADRPWSQTDDVTSPETASTTTTYGPDGTVVTKPDDDASAADHDADLDADRDRTDEPKAVKDDGSFDSPTAVEPATGEPLSSDKSDDSDLSVSDKDSTDQWGKKDDDVADTHVDAAPVPVEPALDTEPVTTPDEDKAHAADATPVVASAAVPAAATSSTSSSDRLFPDGESFAERFRDIQLRFVDSPKEATAEAATLVNEAVDSLTSSLRSQRDSLTGGSDDTEKLRVELRAYRDLLNRLTSL